MYFRNIVVFTIHFNYDNIQVKVVFKLTLGERLKTARKFRGLTQDGLANKIGTSRGVITNIEHNKIEVPQSLIIHALCDALKVDQEWLINGIGQMESSESIRSSKVLSEIYSLAKELSSEEQLYILDVIKTYRNHFNPKECE